MKTLWLDDRGALIATEWVMIVTVLVLGLLAGLKAVQSAVVNELEEVAGAVGALSQAYSFAGTSGCAASANGSSYFDTKHDYPVSTQTESQDLGNVSCAD